MSNSTLESPGIEAPAQLRDLHVQLLRAADALRESGAHLRSEFRAADARALGVCRVAEVASGVTPVAVLLLERANVLVLLDQAHDEGAVPSVLHHLAGGDLFAVLVAWLEGLELAEGIYPLPAGLPVS